MGGRASLIMVIGFAIIFGMINLNMVKLTNRSVGNVVGYYESSLSRVVAYSGAQAGLALHTSSPNIRGVVANKDFADGPFKGSGYTVTLTDMPSTGGLPGYLRLTCVSRCTTFEKTSSGDQYILRDSVIVRFDTTRTRSFSTLAWMTDNEGNVFFIDGDTLWGQVHSNGNIHIASNRWGEHPCFMGLVTTSGRVDPSRNYADFRVGGKAEEHVPERPLPPDINDAINNSTNIASTKSTAIWVELQPGTSADNDGYANIRTGSFTGPIVDVMTLSDLSEKVIYSSDTVHVKGTVDGQLSVASSTNVIIEGDIVYERPPDPTTQIHGSTVNSTKDVLGLISDKNVIISKNHDGDLDLHAAIFARTGSFLAEDYNKRGIEGRINLIGSIAQKDRGAVGTFSGATINSGFLKSYRYDNRFWPQGDGFVGDLNPLIVPPLVPPSFPGWTTSGPLAIRSWWESSRRPFNSDEYL